MNLYLVQMNFYGDRVIMTHAAKNMKEAEDYVVKKYGDALEDYVINLAFVKGYDIILKEKKK